MIRHFTRAYPISVAVKACNNPWIIWVYGAITTTLVINASKCKVLTVTRKSNPLCFDYHLGDTTLVHVRKEKDLGCIITNHLTWDQQVLVVVCKANKMLGLLRRTCSLLITNTKVRRSLYLSLVKCHLDYATQVWSPALTSLKIEIENVQRRATRWILKQRKGEKSYKERRVTVKLLPLCYDREVKDLVFFYKAMHGYINLDVNNFVSFVTHGRTRLSEARTLKTPSCRTSTFQGSYFNRIYSQALEQYYGHFHFSKLFQLIDV